MTNVHTRAATSRGAQLPSPVTSAGRRAMRRPIVAPVALHARVARGAASTMA